MRVFVTGTDTDAGKTYVSCLLLGALAERVKPGEGVCGFKPLCSGGRSDAELLRAASRPQPALDLVNPCWWTTPAAPPVAAQMENRPPDMDAVRDAWTRLSADYPHILVEGVGGWLAPVTDNHTVADLARDFALPVVVVTANRLGAINHTLLTVDRIVKDGLTCAGVILNCLLSEDDPVVAHNRSMLARHCAAPILGEVTRGQLHLDPEILDNLAAALPPTS